MRTEDLWKKQEAWGKGIWPDVLRPTIERVVAAVEGAAGHALTARRHGPRRVEITAMRKPDSDDLIIHVVNYAVDLSGEVTPARDVTISVASPGSKTADVVEWHSLDGVEQVLRPRTGDGRTEFTIPEVAIYGIALVRGAAG